MRGRGIGDLHELNRRDLAVLLVIVVRADGVGQAVGEDAHESDLNGYLDDPTGQQYPLPPVGKAEVGLVSVNARHGRGDRADSREGSGVTVLGVSGNWRHEEVVTGLCTGGWW